VFGQLYEREYEVKIEQDLSAAFVPRLWAGEYLRRLLGGDVESERTKIVSLGVEYGLMTPFTSILALESEQAYGQQGIQRRRSPLRGLRLSQLTSEEERSIVVQLAAIGGTALGYGCTDFRSRAAEPPSPQSMIHKQEASLIVAEDRAESKS